MGVKLQYAFEALTNQWNLLLLSYDYTAQNELFGLLGFAIRRAEMFVLSGGAIIGFIIWLQYRNKTRARKEPEEILFKRITGYLSNSGITHRPEEGPKTYFNRCVAHLPELKTEFEMLSSLYIDLRYNKSEKRRASLRHLRRNWRRLKRQINSHPKTASQQI